MAVDLTDPLFTPVVLYNETTTSWKVTKSEHNIEFDTFLTIEYKDHSFSWSIAKKTVHR